MRELVEKKPGVLERRGNDEYSELWLVTVFFIVLCGICSQTFAADYSQITQDTKPNYKLSGEVTVETASNINRADASDVSGLYDVSISMLHNPSALSSDLSVSYKRPYTRESDDGQPGDFRDIYLGMKKGFGSQGFLKKLYVGMDGYIPVSRDSQRTTFRGSVGPFIKMAFETGSLGLIQKLGYRYNFFEFDIQNDGTVNSPNTVSSRTIIEYKFIPRWSVALDFIFAHVISFQNVGKSRTVTDVSLNFDLSERVGLSVAMETASGTLAPDGVTNRPIFFDRAGATALLDLKIEI